MCLDCPDFVCVLIVVVLYVSWLSLFCMCLHCPGYKARKIKAHTQPEQSRHIQSHDNQDTYKARTIKAHTKPWKSRHIQHQDNEGTYKTRTIVLVFCVLWLSWFCMCLDCPSFVCVLIVLILYVSWLSLFCMCWLFWFCNIQNHDNQDTYKIRTIKTHKKPGQSRHIQN
jgi:hypothetical protein